MGDTELFLAFIKFRRQSPDTTLGEIDRLIAAGADIDGESFGYSKRTVLQVAIDERNEWLIEALLDRGADSNHRNWVNRTPLHDIVDFRMTLLL